MVQGIILDVDGTLLLSNDAHAFTWVLAYEDFGYNVDFAQVWPLVGMGGDKLIATVTPELNSEDGVGKQITQRRQEILLAQFAPTLEPAPGSRELVRRLNEAGLQVVVASSSKRRELQSLLKAALVDDLIPDTTSSSDAQESKPAPDIVQVALEKLGLPPEDVLMVGDTPYDIESAKKAGVGVIAVRCGGWTDDALAGAIAIYDNPADLTANFDSSPLAPKG
jgi:HAD superfamily hydrolase (TIGR01509 family)